MLSKFKKMKLNPAVTDPIGVIVEIVSELKNELEESGFRVFYFEEADGRKLIFYRRDRYPLIRILELKTHRLGDFNIYSIKLNSSRNDLQTDAASLIPEMIWALFERYDIR